MAMTGWIPAGKVNPTCGFTVSYCRRTRDGFTCWAVASRESTRSTHHMM